MSTYRSMWAFSSLQTQTCLQRHQHDSACRHSHQISAHPLSDPASQRASGTAFARISTLGQEAARALNHEISICETPQINEGRAELYAPSLTASLPACTATAPNPPICSAILTASSTTFSPSFVTRLTSPHSPAVLPSIRRPVSTMSIARTLPSDEGQQQLEENLWIRPGRDRSPIRPVRR